MGPGRASTLHIQNIDKYKFPLPDDLLTFFGRFGSICHISIEPQLCGVISPDSAKVSAGDETMENKDVLGRKGRKNSREESPLKKTAQQPVAIFKARIMYFLEDNAQKAFAALHNHLHGKFRLHIVLEVSTRILFPAYVPPWQRSHEFFSNATLEVLRNSMRLPDNSVDEIRQALDEHRSVEPFITYVPALHEIPFEVRYLIDTTAKHVAQFGQELETAISQREKHNEIFRLFLWPENSDYDWAMRDFKQKCRTYYLWRVFSLFNGDTLTSWRSIPYQPFQAGAIWFPPECNANKRLIASKPSADADLPDSDQQALFALLRSVNSTNDSVATVSQFILHNHITMTEVVEIVSDSIKSKQATAERVISRLYVLNDILHNAKQWDETASTGIRNFIGAFQPFVHGIIRSAYAKATEDPGSFAEFRGRVDAVVQSWKEASIYSKSFLENLWDNAFREATR